MCSACIRCTLGLTVAMRHTVRLQLHDAAAVSRRVGHCAKHALREQRLLRPRAVGPPARAHSAHALRKRLPHQRLLRPLCGHLRASVQTSCNIKVRIPMTAMHSKWHAHVVVAGGKHD